MFDWLRVVAEPAGCTADILALVAYIYGFTAMMSARSRYLQRGRLLDVVTRKESAFAVSIGVGIPSLRALVDVYLKEHFPDVPVAIDYSRQGVVPVKELSKVIKEIRDKLREVVSAGTIRRLLLFYGGPYAVAMAIGGIADNLVPVGVFQFDSAKSTYEFAYTLDLEMVKGIWVDLLRESHQRYAKRLNWGLKALLC